MLAQTQLPPHLSPQDMEIRLRDDDHTFVDQFGRPWIDRIRLNGQIACADGWVASRAMLSRIPRDSHQACLHFRNDFVSGENNI